MSSGKNTYRYSAALIAALVGELLFWALFAVGFFVIMKAIPGMRLQRPWALWALAAGPVMTLLFLISIAIKNKNLNRFADSKLLGYLAPNLSTFKTTTKFLLQRFAIGLLVVALVNPQTGSRLEEAKVEGVDIMLALDVSNSMRAEDIKPNRLDRSKRAIEQLVERLRGDRIGIIVFAGQAYVQLPITTDYSAAQMFLNTIDTDLVPAQGTNIGSAINLATRSFNMENSSQKVIVLITDGENHDGDALEAAKKAAEKGIRLFTIGMGSADGSPIPIYQNGTKSGYKKDKDGSTVVSRLNKQMLQDLADAGDGAFVRATTARAGLGVIMDEIQKMEKAEYDTVAYSDYEDRFHPFLVAGLLLLIIDTIITDRKNQLLSKYSIFR